MKNKVLMLCAAIAWGIVSAFAETCTVDGVTYSYQVIDGEAQITDVPSSTSGDLLVPARLNGIPVTSIGSYAFADCDGITSIVFSEGLKSVGHGAFLRSSGLKSVILPDGMTNIEDHAFQYCAGLSSVVMPDTVTTIESGAFASCSSLPALKLPKGITRLEDHLFIYCSGLESVQLPSGLLEVGDGVFCDCDGLTSVSFPAAIEKLEDHVFLRCSGLSEVVFQGPPPSEFGSGVFTYCNTVAGRYSEEYKTEWQAALGSSSSWNGLGMSQVSAESDDSESSAHIEYANLKGAAHTNPTSFKKGDTVAFTTPGHVEGYTFAGWSPQVITADMTNDQVVTANWFTNRYEIAYDSNWGTGKIDNTVCLYGKEAIVASNAFLCGECDFLGWATNKNGEVVFSEGAIVSNLTLCADEIVTLYAIWMSSDGTILTPEFTLSFDANGGDGVMENRRCPCEQAVVLPTNEFERIGYDFEGWMIGDGDKVYEPGMVVSNLASRADEVITVHAVWKSQGARIYDMNAVLLPPWGLAIDYKICGAGVDDKKRQIDVTVTVEDKEYSAQTLVGATDCIDGEHHVYWNMAQEGISVSLTNATVQLAYKTAWKVENARYCVVDLSAGTNATAYPVTYLNEEPEGGFNTMEYKTTKLVLKRVNPGTFIMGEDQTNEAHRVMLTKAFYMGIYEVTQKQWELAMGSNPSYFLGDAKPVEKVSYDMIRGSSAGAQWPASSDVDPAAFLGILRTKTGIDLDLPTEAQWEYTCRAGTATKFSDEDSANGDYMWYWGNSSNSTHEVGTRRPNAWGFYDMHGNVFEWCLDYNKTYGLAYGADPRGPTSGLFRALRGGDYNAYLDDYSSVRAIGGTGGFRVAKTFVDDLTAMVSICNMSKMDEVVESCVVASGLKVEEKVQIGYAPYGTTNAVVAVNGEEVVNSDVAGTLTWRPMKSGDYTLTHTVGDVVLSATYHVTLPQIELDDGTGGVGGAGSRFSYSGTYDGEGHGINVVVPEDVADATVAYALAKDGPYVAENPLFTNACEASTVWYTISAPGYVTYTNSATVAIAKRPVTITSGTKTDFVYDGNPHGIPLIIISGMGFVAGEGIVTSNWATVTTVAQGEVANSFDYAAAEGTDLANYDITVVTGKLAVVRAAVVPAGGGDASEPGDGTLDEGALSKFDATFIYDGEGHTIKTNELCAAFASAMGAMANETKIWYAVVEKDESDGASAGSAAGGGTPALPSEGWSLAAPEFTNVCEEVVWYKVTNPNYEDYVHAAKVKIAKRPVTITSGTKNDFVYDGNPHGIPLIIISGIGFAAGEGIVTSNWATVTTMAQGEVANTFDYAAAEGTDLANYDITTSFGTLAVTKRKIVAENADGAVDSSSASTYNGYLYDDEETPIGTIQAKVAKARLNRRTRQWSSSVTVAILIAGEKKISLRGTLDVESGALVLKAKDGRLLDLQLGANGMSGAFGDYVIDGARDVFSSKAADDKARANAALAKWQGALAIVSDTGTFSVTVYSKGKMRITGTLADGMMILASAQLIVGETCSCIPVVVSKKTLNLAFCIWLGDDGETVEVVGLGEDVVCGRPGALADGAAFRIDAAAICELLGDDTFADYLPDGVSVVQKGTKWIVANGARTGRVVLGKDGNVDEAKAGANPFALRLAYKAKDGSFSGSFKVYVLYRGKPKATTVTVSGVVIDGVGYGTATIRKVGSVAVRIE